MPKTGGRIKSTCKAWQLTERSREALFVSSKRLKVLVGSSGVSASEIEWGLMQIAYARGEQASTFRQKVVRDQD
jgi:hypothetical protein